MQRKKIYNCWKNSCPLISKENIFCIENNLHLARICFVVVVVAVVVVVVVVVVDGGGVGVEK